MRQPPLFHCRLCGQFGPHAASLSLGRIPVCNRFRAGDVGTLVDLDVVECETCQLIQLREAPPIDVLRPDCPGSATANPKAISMRWSRRAGPSPAGAPGAGHRAFEQPLLSRLSARGLSTAALELDVAPAKALPLSGNLASQPQRAAACGQAARSGTFDLVSCRYIVEHTQAPVAALKH